MAPRALLVIAHPDDETLFFSPLILALGASLRILCLSTGGAYGQGSRRPRELTEACAILGVPPTLVQCVDDPGLQDGMRTQWPHDLVLYHVHQSVQRWDVSEIITFDRLGVSGHINHMCTHHGVRAYLAWREAQGLPELRAWELVTTSLHRKYTALAGPLLEQMLVWVVSTRGQAHAFWNTKPWKTVQAMSKHRSQLVWYRWLFVLFSRYTWYNELVRLQPLSHV